MGAISTSAPDLWLKADAITGLVDGDPVGSWPDSSGNSRTATQSTSGNKPTYKTNQLNGLPVVRFDGTNDYLTSSASTSGAAQTVIVVFKTTTAGTYRALRGTSSTGGLYFRLDQTTDKLHTDSMGIQAIGQGATAVANNTWHIASTTYDATSNASFRLDGKNEVYRVGAVSLTASRTTVIGSRDGTAEWFPGDIAEVLSWSRILTSTEFLDIEAEIATKYGLLGSTYVDTAVTSVVATATTDAGGGWEAWRLFDGTIGGSGGASWSASATPTQTVKAQLSAAAVVTSYKVTARTDAASSNASAWTFDGSNDNSSWTTLDTQTSQSWSNGQTRTYTVSNSTAYLYYRMVITATQGGGATWPSFTEWTLVQPNVLPTPVATVPNAAAVGSVQIGSASVPNAAVVTAGAVGISANVSNPATVSGSPYPVAGVTNPAGVTADPVTVFTAGIPNPAVVSADFWREAAVVNPAGVTANYVDLREASVPNPATVSADKIQIYDAAVPNPATVDSFVIFPVDGHGFAEFSGHGADPGTGYPVTTVLATAEFTGHANTPTDTEHLTAQSTAIFRGHAATSLNVIVDPVTRRPEYRLILVDKFGVPGPELAQADLGDISRVLKGRGGFSFTLPKNYRHTHLVRQYSQVQVWIGSEMVPEAWYYIVDPVKDAGGKYVYNCSGLRWLFENVRIGKERPELLKNGGFEQGMKYWTPVWFAGSASEAPPITSIVTGAAALDGGKALLQEAVESVKVSEQKTDAIFLGNRPYATEPLANGFVSGGEAVIRNMIKDIAKNTHITVECYTADVDGGTGQALSERRAAASKAVILADRPDLTVTDIGRGETVQVAPNNTPANQAKNRRIVITYTATRVGHRQAVRQRFLYTVDASARVATELELNGWLDLIDYVGPSKDRYGLYIDRRLQSAPEKILDFKYTDLPDTFPKEKWKADSTSILGPADGHTYVYEVRLYGSAGQTTFDEISVMPNLFLRFFNVDQPTALKKLVEHAQDPAYFHVDLNVETYCPPYGPKNDYEYAWKDHRIVDDAIREIIQADDAPDFWITTTPTRRIAKTARRRGRPTNILLKYGDNVESYTSAVLGDNVSTTAIVTSSRDGGGQAEAIVRGPAVNGLVLERLQAAEPNRQVTRLREMGAGMNRYGRTDVITSVTLRPEVTVYMLGHVSPGDVCPVEVAGLNADGTYRISGINHSLKRNQLSFDLVPEM